MIGTVVGPCTVATAAAGANLAELVFLSGGAQSDVTSSTSTLVIL